MSNHDMLCISEADYCREILQEFEREKFLTQLTTDIKKRGGVKAENKSLLFELRFAKELKDFGIIPEYEQKTVDGSSVDFCFEAEDRKHAFTELVSIQCSDAIRQGTTTEFCSGIEYFETLLSTDNENHKLSEEGEIILAQQKICQKVFSNNKPVKFPSIAESAASYHIIVVDMRNVMIGGCNQCDYKQLAYGNNYVAQDNARLWRDPKTGKVKPIIGIFENDNPLRGAQLLRERIHAIIFTNCEEYEPKKLLSQSVTICNPHLIKQVHEKNELKRILRLERVLSISAS